MIERRDVHSMLKISLLNVLLVSWIRFMKDVAFLISVPLNTQVSFTDDQKLKTSIGLDIGLKLEYLLNS